MKSIQKFFWLCSGANMRHLEDCPLDHNRYAGIGAAIFFTALFAALACYYAVYTAFENYLAAAALGVLWGALIFNLDRLIVSGLHSSKNFWRNLFRVLPRLALAVVISIVIAKPLELKLFDKEIRTELTAMQQEISKKNEGLLANRYSADRDRYNRQINKLKAEIAARAELRDELRKIAREEADGTGGTGLRNPGPIYQIKKAAADKAEAELQALEMTNGKQIAATQLQLDSLNREATLARQSLVNPDVSGLAMKLTALERLADRESTIWWAVWFVTLLFIILECSPVLVKLMMKNGPYEYVTDLEAYKYLAEASLRKAKVSATKRKQADRLGGTEKQFLVDKLEEGLNEI